MTEYRAGLSKSEEAEPSTHPDLDSKIEEIQSEIMAQAPEASNGDKKAIAAVKKLRAEIADLEDDKRLRELAAAEEIRRASEAAANAELERRDKARQDYAQGLDELVKIETEIKEGATRLADLSAKHRDTARRMEQAGMGARVRGIGASLEAIRTPLYRYLRAKLRDTLLELRANESNPNLDRSEMLETAKAALEETLYRPGEEPKSEPTITEQVWFTSPPARTGGAMAVLEPKSTLIMPDGKVERVTGPSASVIDQARSLYIGGKPTPVKQEDVPLLEQAGYTLTKKICHDGQLVSEEPFTQVKESDSAIHQ